MPRKLRVEYPGAVYHVMCRGDRREDIFLDDVDRQDFLKTLAEACEKTGWQVHAYCLMRNHYHLVLETPNANLVAGMAWLQSTPFDLIIGISSVNSNRAIASKYWLIPANWNSRRNSAACV